MFRTSKRQVHFKEPSLTGAQCLLASARRSRPSEVSEMLAIRRRRDHCSPSHRLGRRGKMGGAKHTQIHNRTLGVDSLSILFNHRSFQKPAVSPGFGVVLQKDSDAWKEWNWKVPLGKPLNFRVVRSCLKDRGDSKKYQGSPRLDPK